MNIWSKNSARLQPAFDEARLDSSLLVRVTLARAQVRTGTFPGGADERPAAVASVDRLDLAAIVTWPTSRDAKHK